MSTNFKLFASATIIVGLLTVSAFQHSSIISYENIVKTLNNTVAEQAITIEDQSSEIEELNTSNYLLTVELDLVKDSLNLLQEDLFSLRKQVQKSKKSLAAVENELKIRQQELDFVKSQIKTFQKVKKSAKKKQTALADKVTELEEQIAQLNYMRITSTKDMKIVEEKHEEKVVVANKMTNLKNIMDKTIVDYRGVSIKSDRDGDSLNKLKKEGRNWKYTVINFDLQNAVPALLLDAEFEWRIVDMDNGEALSFIESNKMYPNGKDRKGLTFSYPGYAQETVFINTQAKEGNSYELKLYYVEDGQAYYVNGSSRPIIFDRNIID